MIYAASDLHGNLPDVPDDAELLLLVGDICPDFRPRAGNHWDFVDTSGVEQGIWLQTEFRRWLEPLADRNVEVVAVWGNHDFVGEHQEFIPELPWNLIQDELVTVQGINIYGTPWVPGLPYWAFFGDERKLALRAEAIPDNTDILMTHGPPYRGGDFIPTSVKQREKYGNYDGEFVGDKTLNAAIKRVRPEIVLCGHIHEARGKHWVEGVKVMNVAAVDATYNLLSEPWTKVGLKRKTENSNPTL